jgi:hypothetical protein
MGEREATRQVLVVLPVELVDAIDAVVLRRGRSAWIEQACRVALTKPSRRGLPAGVQQERPETTPSPPKRQRPVPPPPGKVRNVEPRFKR